MSKSLLFQCSHKKPLRLLHIHQKVQKQQENTFKSYKIGENIYHNTEIIQDISILMNLIRSRWFCVQEATFNNVNIPLQDLQSSREFINEAFEAVVYTQNQNNQEQIRQVLNTFSSSIVPLNKLNEDILRKIKLSRQESCPYYVYLHTLLEIYYYMMVLCSLNSQLKIENLLENILTNLWHLYKTSIEPDLCNCVQYFWLSIQLVTEKADNKTIFWTVFNDILKSEDPLKALSFLKELATIQKYNEEFEDVGTKCKRINQNYYFLELKFKELLNQASSHSLVTGFKLIEPLICDLWLKEGKIDILQIIWEFYSKRLNVSNKNCQDLRPLEFIETLDTVLFCPKNCTEDFEIYVGLLLFHLKEYPLHWGKMKGRIYSQLGPNKVKDLTEIGIRHVMMLFLALSTIYFEEVEKKMFSFLDSLPKEKKYTSLVWNMYAAVVLKYVRDKRSVEKVAPSMLAMLQEASNNQIHFHLIKEFIINLESIINNSANMQLHQWLLFGSWLGKYQCTCYYSDLTYSLNVIELLLEKCNNPDSWPFWENFFRDIIYANLKQLALTSNAPAIIGKIAGKLTLSYNNLANMAFEFFNDDKISPNISSMFLEVILDNYPDNLILTDQQETILLQSWIKICFLTLEPQSKLTANVVKLDIFPALLKGHLKSSRQPMEAFIEYLNNNYCTALSMQARNDIINLSDLAFGNLDKTLTQYLKNPDNDQIVLQIYKYSSQLFINCGNLMYNPNKAKTLLTKLIEVLLLPMDFLMGKRQLHNFILNAIKIYWSTFFQALVKLNKTKDPYLERILKDLIVNYLPQFSTSNSPIVNALDDLNMAQIILDKISSSFFKPPIKETDTPNLLKSLKIISDVANSTRSPELFKVLINKTLYGLFEVVILHSQRSSAITVIKQITNSPLFSQVGQEFKQAILEVTSRNMGLNTINYFQLMICLSKFVPNEIKNVLEDIKFHVGNVERLRGVGYDKSLRLQLEKLENSLESTNC